MAFQSISAKVTTRGLVAPVLCCALLATAVSCSGTATPTAAPAERSASFERATEPLQRSLSNAVEDLDISGAAMAVIDGSGRWIAVDGYANPDLEQRVDPDTPFAIASITKTFTTTAALLLAEDGVVDLDAPIAIAGLAPTTLRDLLGHTSGLGYEALKDDRPWAAAELAQRLERDRFCPLRACWHYSDLGFVAAGLVLEDATGEPLRDLYDRLLFAPLHLDHTALVDRDHIPAGIALTDEPRLAWPPAPAVPVNTWSAGAIVTTAIDLARFGHALLTGDILDEPSLAQMLDTDRSRDLPCAPDCPTYGLGIQRYRVGGHAGWGHSGASGAELVHFDDGPTIAVLSSRPRTGRAILERAATEAIPTLAPRADIYDIDASGQTEPRRLTDARAVDVGPSWSPDGTRLAFSSTRDQDHAQLYVLNTETGTTKRLTRSAAIDEHAAWSPTGDRIAFVRDDTWTRELYTIRPDGTGIRQLTDENTHGLWNPAWSPDGTTLAYEIGEGNEMGSDIAVIGADGTGSRILHHDGSEWWPTWSPDGTRVAYWRGGVGIVVANADGSDEHAISGNHSDDRAPAWGPDDRIAFLEREDIWTMNADGSDRSQITDTNAVEGRPQWSPSGGRLVFSSDET